MTDLSHITESLRPLAVQINDLHLDPANARTGHAVDRIAASLARYGQRKPLVVNRNENNKIEAGNGTWQAAKSLGWQWIAAVFVEDDPMTAVGYGIADNRLGDLSEWDSETLQTLIDSLDPDLNLPTGFNEDELDELLAGLETAVTSNREAQDAEPQTSRADELRQEWQTETGQLWILPSRDGKGEHRLIVGDCTDRAVVERVMGGEKADIAFTSPPYNLGGNIKISNRPQSMKDKGSVYDGADDSRTSADYLDLLIKSTDVALSVSSYALVNVQQLAGNKTAIIDYLCRYKNRFADVAIWHKTNQQPAMAERVMNSCFEYIFFFSAEINPTRAIKTASFKGEFDNVYTSTINVNEFADVHGAAFPLEFASHFIGMFCPKLCVDQFCGTGTTLIACENLNRYCRAVEISPAYCAVILQRYLDTFQIRPYLAP